MCPYLKTSGSGPIRSWEMVGISGLNQDLRWKRQKRDSAGKMRGGDDEERRGREGGDGQIKRMGDKEGTFEMR